MSSATADTIPIIVDVTELRPGETKGSYEDSRPERREIPVDILSRSLNAETKKLLIALDTLPTDNAWKLNEVEIGLDVTAEGGVSFIGTAKLSGGASIKLKFKK